MKISINNRAQLSNKYLRFIKWKLYQLKEKFDHLIYAEVFIKTEGSKIKQYYLNLRLGIPGNDIILKNQSENLHKLLNSFPAEAHRYLVKSKV
jgi:putative sigma-54 modulation protein